MMRMKNENETPKTVQSLDKSLLNLHTIQSFLHDPTKPLISLTLTLYKQHKVFLFLLSQKQ